MKPPYFENIASELNEKRAHKKFIAADMATESNKPLYHFLYLIAIGWAIANLLIALICLVVLNAEYIDDIPPGVWTIVALAVVALVVGWRIVRSARKQRL